MSEHRKSSEQRLSALCRYISALEQGDIEILAAVLNEASHDPILNAFLEEMDAVYQASDGTAVSELEARRALYSVLAPGQNGHQERNQQAPLSPYMTTQSEKRSKGTLMEEQATLPHPRIQNHHRPSMHQRKRRPWFQLLAALLAVCILIGAAVALISTRQQTGQSGHAPAGAQPLHSIVVVKVGIHNLFYALRPDNGERLWTFTAPTVQEGASSGSSIIVQGQSVYLLVNSQVYALRATDGKQLWHASLFIKGTQQDSYSTFLFDQGMLYVSGDVYGSQPIPQGEMFALRSTDGSIAWHYEGYGTPLLTVHHGVVYVTTDGNTPTSHLRALRGSDGKQLWVREGAAISVVADETTVYVYFAHPTPAGDPGLSKDEKTIVALNAQNGSTRWSIPIISNGADQLQIDQDRLFLSEENTTSSQICSFQTENGHQIWCRSFAANAIDGYSIANNTLYVFSTQRSIVGTETAIIQGTVVSRPMEHEKTVVQVYSESDGKTLKWETVLNDLSSGGIAIGNNTLFISTIRYVWALGNHGQIVWRYFNPLPGESDSQFYGNAFNTLGEGSW